MKERIDVLLVNRGLVPSREKAQAYLMAGSVSVDGLRETKAGTRVDVDAEIVLAKDPVPYVSRGGLKLEAALLEWGIGLCGAVCIDIGASTGGFTDLMLKRGAARVYTIDVGYGQLDYKLRNDPRVVNMEKTNIRLLDPDGFPEKADFIAIDVSFISLKLVLPVAAGLLKGSCGPPSAAARAPEGQQAHAGVSGAHDGGRPLIVCLIKPQFEAERGQVGKGGIVRDAAVHETVLGKVKGYAEDSGFFFAGVIDSPILGTKGNKEFLALLAVQGAAGGQEGMWSFDG